jgi:cellulose synthase/poly-beta-1,6-N-acetylglucosamine synthase-like glycosyltransferase
VEELRVVLSLTLAVLVVALAAFTAASFDALLKGCFEVRRILRATSYDFDSVLLKSPIVPGVSVIFVAPDASPESRALVRRLLDLHFGRHELVLVLNAPPQPALDRWVDEFHLVRQERVAPQDLPTAAIRGYYVSRDPIPLLVVDQQPGGVADAFNAGVNAAQYSVIGLVDGEAEFMPEVLLRLIRPMLGDWERTVAVCGVAPPPRAWWDRSAPSNRGACGWSAVAPLARGTGCCRSPALSSWSNGMRSVRLADSTPAR